MDWLTKKINERTSWDGGAMIAVGLVVLFLGAWAHYAAWAAVAWGAITLLKSED
jgi:hypothetical protein|tara:strand:+ start:1046 stop:1207 length:162 start_codon:yes stop_codon:yes gene_type:complete